ncbi:cytidylate kinase [Herbinix hemicellulosilytica]|uniref:Cytidylate kinase n=1 Tax=Herbinix hemicellulosilytica TaxID=1564487 RepID=A0A0H5SL95_HERHM|nr:cytidylate kinase-like family protein [Herbinix hemicellulosilytica]RBP58059.1 cytidylate kinase [Herbinix hemicellulosilytica]CRZ35516.1 hypothetical protein HHT355_2327 [Herbinix hemicellulosilytica]
MYLIMYLGVNTIKNIITISRQYGSGGREIGEKLAKKFGVPFYDREIITRAAKESGFSEAFFENAEKKATNSLLYTIAMGMNAYGNQDIGFINLSLDDQIYLAQSDVIRKIAGEGPCVIVGRCANYILKDRREAVHVFIWADLAYRKERAINLYGMPKEKAEDNILKIDKQRANYYNYYTGEKWGRTENYHISVRSDYVGIDNAVEIIADYIKYGERR